MSAADASPVVFVVDDDASVAEAVARLLRSVRLDARILRSARDFLEAKTTRRRASSST
jgi:FixJ family two-component response regulator